MTDLITVELKLLRDRVQQMQHTDTLELCNIVYDLIGQVEDMRGEQLRNTDETNRVARDVSAMQNGFTG